MCVLLCLAWSICRFGTGVCSFVLRVVHFLRLLKWSASVAFFFFPAVFSIRERERESEQVMWDGKWKSISEAPWISIWTRLRRQFGEFFVEPEHMEDSALELDQWWRLMHISQVSEIRERLFGWVRHVARVCHKSRVPEVFDAEDCNGGDGVTDEKSYLPSSPLPHTAPNLERSVFF